MSDPDDLQADPATPPAALPEEAPPPDPLAELARALDQPGGAAAAAALDPVDLARLAALAVALARDAPDAAWLDRLGALRLVLLQANARAPLALALRGTADVAAALGQHARRQKALEALVGVRELLGQAVQAHGVVLALADAQLEAGQPAAAVATLTAALDRASRLAPAGHRAEASRAAVATMLRLARVHAAQGHGEEAATWLAGADELARDPDDRARVEEARLALRG